jgi:predicted HNH restriction endonuclease
MLSQTEEEDRNCPHLQIRQDVHVRDGISSIPGYVQVVVDDQDHILLQTQPEAVHEPNEHYEGSAYEVRLTMSERDPVARTPCLQYWGIRCHICGFSFADAYGAAGVGFMHVHHLTPLSQIR